MAAAPPPRIWRHSSDDEIATYDAFGFPIDQNYLVSSHVAELSIHHLRWARYWQTISLNGAPESLPRTEALRRLVWGGIPTAFRGCLWTLLLGVPERRRQQPTYYAALCEKATGAADAEADAEVLEQVAKDADRTWPRHRWLDTDALQRVLIAYSRHDTAVGYCQG